MDKTGVDSEVIRKNHEFTRMVSERNRYLGLAGFGLAGTREKGKVGFQIISFRLAWPAS
jgi:hypothetical protein